MKLIKSLGAECVKLLIIFLTATSLFGCNSENAFSNQSKDGSGKKSLVSVQVSPAENITFGKSDLQIPKGSKLPLVAVGTYSDGTTQDITTMVNWVSSELAVANVSSAGVVTAETEGKTSITASIDELISNELIVVVSGAEATSIQLTPASATIASGSSQKYEAIAQFTDGTSAIVNNNSHVEWFVSNKNVASMSSFGVADGRSVGTTEIFVTIGGVKSNTSNLNVTNARVASIQIEPSVKKIAKGTLQQYKAIATFTDGTTSDITETVTWKASGSHASITKTGLASGDQVGQVTIEAHTNGVVSNKASLTVTDATITKLDLTPLKASVAMGVPQQYEAMATYSDGSKTDITNQAAWHCSDDNIATVKKGLATPLAVGGVSVTASFNGVKSAPAELNVTDAYVASIQITPAVSHLAKGTTAQYKATAIYSDGSFSDITNEVSWLSAETGVATVSSKGLATGVNVGETSVVATFDGVESNEAVITVSAAELLSIQVTPPKATIAKGTSLQFSALGRYSDGESQDITTIVNWSSSAESVTVSLKGLANAVNEGSSIEIKASLGGVTSNTALLNVTEAEAVSIQITPPNASVAKGNSQQYVAIATYTDGSTAVVSNSVNWFSSDPSLASITSGGRVSGEAEGEVRIHATYNSIISNYANLQVTSAELNSIQITPPDSRIAKGNTQQFTAIGNYSDGMNVDITNQVTWSSSDSSVAAISSGKTGGEAVGYTEGRVDVTATLGPIVSNKASLLITEAIMVSIQVTPAKTSIVEGNSYQYVATALYSDGSTPDVTSSVNWSVSNDGVATIINGLVTGVSEGQVEITASKGEVTSNKASLSVEKASIVSIQITPAKKDLPKGDTQQYVAMAMYNNDTEEDVSDKVGWSSSDTEIATVSIKGLATGAKEGSVAIVATLSGVTSNSATLNITSAVVRSLQITPVDKNLPKGNEQQYIAVATYSDGLTLDVTEKANWVSSDTQIATITKDGIAQGVEEGLVTISGSVDGITSNNARLTITSAVINSIEVTPLSSSIAKGNNKQFNATGVYSDGTRLDITNEVSWSSATVATATISKTGLATAIEIGSSAISASKDGAVSNNAELNVTAAVLQNIAVTPADVNLSVGETQQYEAEGFYSDDSSRDITNEVTWKTDNTEIATVTVAGLAQGAKVGSVNVSATKDGISSESVRLNVTPARLERIEVSPSSATITQKGSQQFRAKGIYSDDSERDITSEVSWTSSDTKVATISQSGMAVSDWRGTTQIKASKDSIDSNSVTLQVNAAFIDVTPKALNLIGSGGDEFKASVQYKALVTYGDGSTEDVTNTVTWKIVGSWNMEPPASEAVVSKTGFVEVYAPTFLRVQAELPDSMVFWGETTLSVK
ncbi:beta strand repeat-containing protein [Vibrio jasicida]|uniref:beta strand repeat-containing protein n=1 Tax=Vibrio jasicida TaxID=766224 RepID=UPI004067B63E